MEKMNWINSMYEKYAKDNTVECRLDVKSGVTKVLQTNSKYVKKIGLSYCNPTDKFNSKIGIALAYARLIGEKIPYYVLEDKITLRNVKIGEMFVLKFNHKIYVKVCEHPSYPNEYRCTSIKNGKTELISIDDEVEKIF